MSQNIVKFEAGTLPTNHVTIFNDRAEVCKTIKCHVKQGVNEILVEKLSNSIDSNSIRVEGLGSHCSIAEVKFSEKAALRDDQVKDREKELHAKIKDLKDQHKDTEQSIERLKKQKEVLDGLTRQFGNINIQGGKDEKITTPSTALLTNGDSLSHLERFLDFYAEKTTEIDKSKFDLNKELEKVSEELDVAETQLRKIGGYGCHQNIKQVSIAIHADQGCEITLNLFYLVWNASWRPSYDVRVSNDPAGVKVLYYGQVQQNTDEDWHDAKLTLSTASPVLGGQVPELKTTKIGFLKPIASGVKSHRIKTITEAYSSREVCLDSTAFESAPAMAQIVSRVTENVTSTTFDIVVPTSIPSDNSSHKVTIAIIELEPKFEYESVPSKSVYAYFKAKVINTSQYPFLPGPTSIFFRDSFVANGEMKAANPNEKFEVSLGVDPSIKVEYKAAEKFHEESGLINKCHLVTHQQQITLINTKNQNVKIKVLEPLPLSTDDKLKVTLIEPVLLNRGSEKLNVHLIKNNNIEWLIDLKGAEKRVLVLKYQIEYPKMESLEYKEE